MSETQDTELSLAKESKRQNQALFALCVYFLAVYTLLWLDIIINVSVSFVIRYVGAIIITCLFGYYLQRLCKEEKKGK